MQTDFINEFIKIYKSVFGVTNSISKYWRIDKKIQYMVILTLIWGAAYIIGSAAIQWAYAYIFLILYVLCCIVTGLWINSLLKRKYDDVNYMEKEFASEFIEKVYEEMNFDLKSEKERNVIEEYLQFHSDKERNKKSFLSIFKPGVSWIAFIFPVILPMIISLQEEENIYFFIILSIYIVAISVIILAFKREVKGLTKESILTSILEMINIEKMSSLKQEVMGNRLDALLSKRDFDSITIELLQEAGYKELHKDKINLYKSALHSIDGNVDRARLQQIING